MITGDRRHHGYASALPFHELARHQAGSIIATVLDFSTMILLVAGLHFIPAVGAMSGAAVGGSVNFVLGRRWVFRRQGDRVSGQALRYAGVSAVSLLLNGAGEHVLASVWHLQFVIARVIVALLVALCWNYPAQRNFVFRQHETP
jgi:putative flippase GtrA